MVHRPRPQPAHGPHQDDLAPARHADGQRRVRPAQEQERPHGDQDGGQVAQDDPQAQVGAHLRPGRGDVEVRVGPGGGRTAHEGVTAGLAGGKLAGLSGREDERLKGQGNSRGHCAPMEARLSGIDIMRPYEHSARNRYMACT